jgi:hypothetical protein
MRFEMEQAKRPVTVEEIENESESAEFLRLDVAGEYQLQQDSSNEGGSFSGSSEFNTNHEVSTD